ncbi:hypothetical protein FANTH_12963 [Fusarium anthophilum]|uniref:CCHC-type domain-containing protein n=1 Tax=Fusarium anthophilum TaxID=48485 RepID=A0A8H4YQX5_9HYPO|nr:hypothetical protein FANTH_12963 [Fusarium anthophilum]
MAIQQSNNSGQGSGQGGSSRPRPGHGHATPSDDARPQQSNSEAAAQGTREETGESGSPHGNNSTNNRGRGGPPFRGGWAGPRGGRANRGGRGGYRGSRHGDHQARAPDYGPLACVPQSSQTQVADLGGAVSSRLTNNSLEGGGTNHWFSNRPGERVWGVTRGGGVDDVIDEVMKRAGATSCQFFLIPNTPGRFDQIAAKAVERTWEDSNGYNDKGKPAGILRHGVKMDTETKKPIKCAACGSKGHILATCFSRPGGRDGEQSGCPRCDTTAHHGGDCKDIAALPLPEQVKILVCQRGNMTPFKGKKPWWKLVHEYVTSKHYTPNTITFLPWSKEFTLEMAKSRRITSMQMRHDTVAGFKLPIDQATFGAGPVYWKHWEPNGLAWPPVLGDLPPRPPGPMDTDGTTATVSAPAPQTGVTTGAAPGAAPGPSTGPAPATSGVTRPIMPPGLAGALNLMPPTPVVSQGPAPGNAAQVSVPNTTSSTGAVPATNPGSEQHEIDYEDNEMI